MKYHGKALQASIGNCILLIMDDSLNLESLIYASNFIKEFAKTQSNGFYIVLILEDDVFLPSDCQKYIIDNQRLYQTIGLKRFYLACKSRLQKNLFTESYIEPLDQKKLYIVVDDFDELLNYIQEEGEVDANLIKAKYQEMSEKTKNKAYSEFDMLPNE